MTRCLPLRLHITGASGSGTTTLGEALAIQLGITHLDSDNYYWLPSQPPYQTAREPAARYNMLAQDCAEAEAWVLSGSFMDWGNPIIPSLDLVIFLYVPADERVARLQTREAGIFGESIKPGGERHRTYVEFLNWAADYDAGTRSGRNLQRHEAWLAALPCPVLRIAGVFPVQESLRRVLAALPAA